MSKKVRLDGGKGNQHGLCCPECGSSEQIAIWSTVRAALLPDGVDHDGDTEWTDDSSAVCDACDWLGVVAQLKTDPRHEGGKG